MAAKTAAGEDRRFRGVLPVMQVAMLAAIPQQEEVSDYLKAAEHLPDEMVEAFVALGELDQVRGRLEPTWAIPDSRCMVPPAYNMTADSQLYHLGEIGKLKAV